MLPQHLSTASDQYSSDCFLGQVYSILVLFGSVHMVSYVSCGRIECLVTLFCLVAQVFAESVGYIKPQ